MANRKISDLTALTTPATGDLLPIVDISEAAAADKNKKITFGELFASIPAGTAAAPSVAFEGDSNTGIYSPGADQVAIATNGTSRIVVGADDVLDTAAGNYRGITIKCETTAHRPTLSFFNTTDSLAAYIQATGSSLAFGAMSTDYGGHTEAARIDSSGRLLVGGSPDSGGALLQVFGDRIRIGTAKTPASATATGTTGEIAWDANYIYVCTATNTWKRTAISTW
jgi:hypothetical protein